MSKEFDKLKKAIVKTNKGIAGRHRERYQYARSLGFSGAEARHLASNSIAKILSLSKELK